MPKIKKYAMYLILCFSSIVLLVGGLFTVFQIQSQKQNNEFFEAIENINLIIQNNDFDLAKKKLYETKQMLEHQWWSNSNKKALVALISKKIGDVVSKDVVKNYTSKAENYNEFSLVKECLLRLFFLDEKSHKAMQDFRWKHAMQRIHLLTTLKGDLRYKDILPKQLFDFYLRNLVYMNENIEFESTFIIMTAS